MNDRIKLLAEQATTYIEPTATSGEGWIFNKEKFAELIVAECTNVVAKLSPDRPYMVNSIKKHFEIEE